MTTPLDQGTAAAPLRVVALWVAVSALSLGLGWSNQTSVPRGNLDGLRYLEMADQLTKGDWLGPYDVEAIIRTPFYPLALAFNGWLGTELHHLQQSLYLLSLLPLLLALRGFGISLARLSCVALLCALHPFALHAPSLVSAEAIYVSAVVLAAAAGLGLLAPDSAVKAPWVMLFWLACPLAWHAKPEGIWLLPGFATVAGAVLFGILRSRSDARTRIQSACVWGLMVLAVPLCLTWGVGQWLRHRNLEEYGVAVTHELVEPEFARAMELLTRLAPDSQRPHVPVTQAALQRAYAASPDLARLEGYLSRQTDGRGWAQPGCQSLGICDEIVGGWTIWAVRQGAARIGAHSSARDAANFYRHVADDLERFCTQSTTPCSAGPVFSYLAPPFRLGHLKSWAGSSLMLGVRTLELSALPLFFRASTAATESTPGHGEQMERILHLVESPDRPAGAQPSRVHFGLYSVILIVGFLGLLGAILPLLSSRLTLFRPWWPWTSAATPVCLGLAALLVSRWVSLGYIDALSFPVSPRYLIVVFPFAATLAGLGLPGIERLATAVRRRLSSG